MVAKNCTVARILVKDYIKNASLGKLGVGGGGHLPIECSTDTVNMVVLFVYVLFEHDGEIKEILIYRLSLILTNPELHETIKDYIVINSGLKVKVLCMYSNDLAILTRNNRGGHQIIAAGWCQNVNQCNIPSLRKSCLSTPK